MIHTVFSSDSEIPVWYERSLAKEQTNQLVLSTTGKCAQTKQEKHEEEVTDILRIWENHKEMKLYQNLRYGQEYNDGQWCP